MKVYVCPKCKSKDVFAEEAGSKVGLYCGDCGRWIRWLNKSEVEHVRRQEESIRNKEE